MATFLACVAPLSVYAKPKETCIYIAADGQPKSVDDRYKIPYQFRSKAKCGPEAQNDYLAKPEEISLKGTVRKESMASSLGRIDLRWPRKLETLFGKTPQRAMADAASTVSRALKQGGFPAGLQTLDLDWSVVFMDEDVPESQVPNFLVTNCHPGWMTPPSNIYIVAQRVAAGCGSEVAVQHRVADAEMARVLLHEMGHTIEYLLLRGKGGVNKMRSEGFAAWFEGYSARYSTIVSRGEVEDFYLKVAKQSFRESPEKFEFSGSAADYGRASLYFKAIVDKFGVRRLMDVYDLIAAADVDFFVAAEKATSWNRDRFEKEIANFLK